MPKQEYVGALRNQRRFLGRSMIFLREPGTSAGHILAAEFTTYQAQLQDFFKTL
jgi:hypothetical protein